MVREEEYNFRKDVYTTLVRFTNYRASGFLAGEKRSYKDENVFFSVLLESSDELLGRAYRKGKLIAAYTEPFLGNFKKVVNDVHAYQVFLHQDELLPFFESLMESMSSVDSRFINSFNRYWRDRCYRSIKVLYYRTLIMDHAAPKYEGIGAEPSRLMYEKILAFKSSVDEYLNKYLDDTTAVSPVADSVPEEIPSPHVEIVEKNNEEPVEQIQETVIQEQSVPQPFDATLPDNIPFLNYIYKNVVTKEFPASAILLSVLRSRTGDAGIFYEKVLDMDIPRARKELGIGEISAKEVNKLCNMMRAIVHHPGTRNVYNERDKAELIAPQIDREMANEHVRTYHSYQKFMGSCNNSILNFYLKVAGTSDTDVKFEGLNPTKSKELLNTFKRLLSTIDDFLIGINASPAAVYSSQLYKLNFTEEQRENIVKIIERGGHFPMFTAINYMMARMGERKYEIARKGLNTVYGESVRDLNELAQSLGLSRERVRQLRDNCLDELLTYPKVLSRANLLDSCQYAAQSEYDFKYIREEEGVDFSNEFITICIAIANPDLHIIGDTRKSLVKPSGTVRRLYLVPTRIHKIFDFDKFLLSVEEMLSEKRFYPYRDDLEVFVRGLIKKFVSEEDFYDILKECRQIMLQGYPENIINSQIYFPANARKTIPNIIEDILREFNRPMTAEEICEELNSRYPDLEQIPSKIGPNALRNSNIVAVSRTSTYALIEWNYTEKRGGTIRDLAVEYLNSLFKPIAPLTDICDYIAKFREDVKESSVKANLLAESNNRFSMYYKGDILHIGFSDIDYGDEYVLQEKRQGRRSFKDSIVRLEEFIKANDRFPYTAGVEGEEARLSRFYSVAKGNQKKGTLSPEELAELERIDETYGHLRVKKERVSWEERLERFAKHITENESLPYPSSKEYAWYEENKVLFDTGELEPARAQSFAFLLKIMRRMNLL